MTGERTATCRCGKPLQLVAKQTWQHADGKTYRHRIEVTDRGKPERVDLLRVGDGDGVLVLFDHRPFAFVVPSDTGAVVHYLAVMPLNEHHASVEVALQMVVEQERAS